MGLTRKEILKALALKTETVPFAGGKVTMSELSAPEYMEVWNDPEIRVDGKVDNFRFPVALVIRSVRDDKGEHIFTPEDLPLLLNSSRDQILELIEVAKRLNGLGEMIVKNSEETVQDS